MLKIISDCEVNLVSGRLATARANKIDWTDLEALARYLYNFAAAMINAVPE